MKTAAKVFIIIGLVSSIILIVFGFALIGMPSSNSEKGMLNTYFIYAIYSLITSIGSLVAVNGTSKGAVIAWGVFYIPVNLLSSIFMFCIKEDDLY